jgi:hypothetical protein
VEEKKIKSNHAKLIKTLIYYVKSNHAKLIKTLTFIHENNWNIENCLKYIFIKLSCNWHVKSSSIYPSSEFDKSWRNGRSINGNSVCKTKSIFNTFQLLYLYAWFVILNIYVADTTISLFRSNIRLTDMWKVVLFIRKVALFIRHLRTRLFAG